MVRFLFFCLLLVSSKPVFGQQAGLNSDKMAVLDVVTELFDAYRAGDSTGVRAVFSSDANLQRAFYDDSGKSRLNDMSSVDGFVGYVGGGLNKLHDEQLWEIHVSVNNNLASIWAKFAFFLDGKFHHCGAENFLLFKNDVGEWKIFHLVDTNQTDTCDVPDSIMKNSTF